MNNSNADHFDADQLKSIKLCLSSRYRIEELLNKFDYKEDKSYEENIASLCEALMDCFQLENCLKSRFFYSFQEFISLQQNIPIEVNFHKIKYEQLGNLFEQWQTSLKQLSMTRLSQRLYSIQHRNIIFSRVFVEEKQNISTYFSTISQKQMLKGVDLYQLLVDILSPYYLYQFLSDNETFFEKVNSFNGFLQVVERFIHSERRIIIDQKSKDFEYIRLYQFEALVYSWESTNPELELRAEKRFSYCTKQVQTEQHEIMRNVDCEVQTTQTRDKLTTLEETINAALKQLNILTEDEGQTQKLQIIQSICESLRKGKIKLLTLQKSKMHSSGKKSQPPLLISQMNSCISIASIMSIDIEKQQKQIGLQKSQRISMRGPIEAEESRESFSKSKNYEKLHAQKLINQNRLSYNNRDHRISLKDSTPEKQYQKLLLLKPQPSQSQGHNRSSSSLSKPINPFTDKQANFQKNQNESRIRQLNIPKQSQSKGKNKFKYDNQKKVRTQNDGQQITILSLFGLIFHHYSDKKSGSIDIDTLHKFFVEIGISQQNQTNQTFNLIKRNFIKNLNKIKITEFLQIMGSIIESDQDFTYEVISEFVDLYIKPSKKQQSAGYVSKVNHQHKVHKQEDGLMIGIQKRDQKRKRYKYSEETSKHQNSTLFIGLSEPRNTFLWQEKVNIPLRNFNKVSPSKYARY